jgi:hypothetical protein
VSRASGLGGRTWSWPTVHQAIGMTMEHLNGSGLAAFEALIAQARATGQTVSDLSADVVERRFRFHAVRGQ